MGPVYLTEPSFSESVLTAAEIERLPAFYAEYVARCHPRCVAPNQHDKRIFPTLDWQDLLEMRGSIMRNYPLVDLPDWEDSLLGKCGPQGGSVRFDDVLDRIRGYYVT